MSQNVLPLKLLQNFSKSPLRISDFLLIVSESPLKGLKICSHGLSECLKISGSLRISFQVLECLGISPQGLRMSQNLLFKVSQLSQNLLLLTKDHLASCLYTLARFQERLFITESTLNNSLDNIYAPKTRDGNGQSCGLAEAATMPLTLGLHLPPSTWVMPEPADAGVQGPARSSGACCPLLAESQNSMEQALFSSHQHLECDVRKGTTCICLKL